MDYSAAVEPQQHFLHHQQAQDQHQQLQLYDPVQLQLQPYDQASQVGYPYYPNSQHQYPSQQPYSHYSSDYSIGTASSAYPQAASQSENLQPPGISAAPETPQLGGAATHQSVYFHHDQQSSYPVPQGLNPAAAAAVAALSQLQQFAGSMDAAERAAMMQGRHQWPLRGGGYPYAGMQSQPGHPLGVPFRPPVQSWIWRHVLLNSSSKAVRPLYRGGGRRGGAPFRGGRSNHGHPHSRSDFGASHSRGRGRGRGGGARRISHPGTAAAHSESVSDVPSTALKDASSGKREGPAELAVSSKRIPQVSWCELCMVDCNSLEILQQHLNGKRHKKNVQRLQEFESHKRRMVQLQLQEGSKPMQQQKQTQQEHLGVSLYSQLQIDDQRHQQPLEEQQEVKSLQFQPQTAEPPLQQPLEELQQVESVQVPPHQEPLEGPQQVESLQVQPVIADKQHVQPLEELLQPQPVAEKPQQQDEQQQQQDAGQQKPQDEPQQQVAGQQKPQDEQQQQLPEVVEAEDKGPPNADEESMKAEADKQNACEQSEAPKVVQDTQGSALPRRGSRGRGYWDDRRRALKRGRMRFNHGGKRMRMAGRMMNVPSKQTKEEPKFCSLCHVTCDTQAVFDSHLAGKKHMSRVKRSQGAYDLHSYYGLQPHPAAYVPRGYHQPIFYSHQGPQMVNHQLVAQAQVIEEVALQLQVGGTSEAFQGQAIVGSADGGACLGGHVQNTKTVASSAQDSFIVDTPHNVPRTETNVLPVMETGTGKTGSKNEAL